VFGRRCFKLPGLRVCTCIPAQDKCLRVCTYKPGQVKCLRVCCYKPAQEKCLRVCTYKPAQEKCPRVCICRPGGETHLRVRPGPSNSFLRGSGSPWLPVGHAGANFSAALSTFNFQLSTDSLSETVARSKFHVSHRLQRRKRFSIRNKIAISGNFRIAPATLLTCVQRHCAARGAARMMCLPNREPALDSNSAALAGGLQ